MKQRLFWALNLGTLQGPLRHLRKAAQVPEVLVAVICLQFVIGSPVYAGSNRWTSNGNGPGFPQIWALAINPSTPTTLYAGTNGAGVFKSTDAGASWTGTAVGLAPEPASNAIVYALAINPSTPTTLYAGTGFYTFSGVGGGVFKSTDAGGSWTAVNSRVRRWPSHRPGAKLGPSLDAPGGPWGGTPAASSRVDAACGKCPVGCTACRREAARSRPHALARTLLTHPGT